MSNVPEHWQKFWVVVCENSNGSFFRNIYGETSYVPVALPKYSAEKIAKICGGEAVKYVMELDKPTTEPDSRETDQTN